MTDPAMEWASSDLLFTYVASCDEIDPRLKRSFERIKVVCDEISDEARAQSKRGARFSSNPIYIAEVGRRCKAKFGGPSGESITRNRGTEPLKAIYVELRAAELDLPGLSDDDRDPLSSVSDAGVKAYIRTLEARIKINEEIIVGLTGTLKKIRPISLDRALVAASEGSDELELEQGVVSMVGYDEVVRVIRKLLDPRHLSQFGLRSEGGVFNPATGEELLSEHDVALMQGMIRHK